MKTETKVWAVVVVAFLISSGEAMAAGKRGPSRQTVSGVVNLNTATMQQLDSLPGVGEKAAKRIVDYRQKTPFTRIEELVKVKGFGKKKFDKLKAHLTLSGPTTLTVARAGSAGTGAAAAGNPQGRGSPPKR
jgi:competence protein ComEA